MSRNLISYIACSLDGYIADINGSIDWLDINPPTEDNDYGYSKFLQSIDTTLMGRSTYEQVLGFDIEFPYKSYKNYVFSTNTDYSGNEFVEIAHDPVRLVSKIKQESGKDIWVIGGEKINSVLYDANLIDTMIISYIPIILGSGIKLFRSRIARKMNLVDFIKFSNGVIQLNFEFEK